MNLLNINNTMGKKAKSRKKKSKRGVSGNKKINSEKILKRDVKKHITAIILLLFALIFSLSLFGQAGIVGKFTDKILTTLFGAGKYVLPVLMVSLGVMYFKRMQQVRYYLATGGMLLFFLAGIGLAHSFYDVDDMASIAKSGMGGGYVGLAIAYSLMKLIGKFAEVVALVSLALIGFMLLFNAPVFNLFHKFKDFLHSDNEEESGGLEEHSGVALTNQGNHSESVMMVEKEKHNIKSIQNKNDNELPVETGEEKIGFFKRMFKSKQERKEQKIEKLGDNIKSVKFTEEIPPVEQLNVSAVDNNLQNVSIENGGVNEMKKMPASPPVRVSKKARISNGKNKTIVKNNSKWKQPVLSIFEKSEKSHGEKNIEDNIDIIQRTLEEFGIAVEPSGFNIGPTVTQYTFSPPRGVMLNKIVGLQSNIALALAASAIRIEAPIPGTSLIGIEVPNSKATMIRLGTLFAEDEFSDASSHLTMALGNDVNGNSIIVALEKTPHLLVAGSTNTGKSVCINAILSSLIFKNSPDDLQLILVDPKRVELSAYNGIPHLLTKVIVDMNKVVNTLKWATGEMDSRYKLLEEVGSKNIESYNDKVKNGETKQVVDMESGEIRQEVLRKMPYIVIVIDELADLMATNGKEVESLIVRLSQMARAVGIHLILSTQRPDANVITGTIKNNIPARIAFKVAGNVDSRTILDRPGAEKLLGNGDMLYMGPGYPQPTRIQGPFVSEGETAKLIKFIKKQAKKIKFKKDETLKESLEGKMEEEIISGDVREGENSSDDVLYSQAKEMIIAARQASISSLQRRLSIGYNRSAKIIDALEENGVIGPANGSKPREVLIADDVTIIDEVSPTVEAGSENVVLEDPLVEQEARDRRQF
jgi:S-DNA-T family DNA segregation ATPase FtsK/SpoIIIE